MGPQERRQWRPSPASSRSHEAARPGVADDGPPLSNLARCTVADPLDRSVPSTQLLVYRFGAGARFEGQLVGALERIESGGALRIRDALFVQNNAETGELEAVAVRGDGAGGLVAPLIGFRLDPAERRRATRRALSSASATTVHHLGAELGEGEAMAVVLVEHVWARALEDAVARLGGTPVVREFVDASALAELSAEKL